MYPEMMIAPMRQELTSAGIAEARTADDVSQAVQQKGTVMVVVNSVCGCAAGKMRPGVRAAIQHSVRPERMITVFAVNDRDARQTESLQTRCALHWEHVQMSGAQKDGKRSDFAPALPAK